MATATTDVGARISRCAVCKIDQKGRFVFADEEAERLFGAPQVELFGRPLKDSLDAEDHGVIDEITGGFSRFETRYDTTHVTFIDQAGKRVPASVIVSQNFIAGNPVNYQIVIKPDALKQDTQAVGAGSSDDSEFLEFLLQFDPNRQMQELTDRVQRFTSAEKVGLFDLASEPPALVAGTGVSKKKPSSWNENAKSGKDSPYEASASFEIGGELYILRAQSKSPKRAKGLRPDLSRINLALSLVQRIVGTGHTVSVGATDDSPIVSLLDRVGVGVICFDPKGEVTNANDSARLLFDEYGIVQSIPALIATLGEKNESPVVDSIASYLDTCNEVSSAPDLTLALRMPSSENARLTVIRTAPGSDDLSGFFVFQPMSLNHEQAGNRRPDNRFLARAVEHLCSAIAAGQSVWQKIQHEHHNELGRNGAFHLKCLANHMDKVEAILTEVNRASVLIFHPEEPELTDLGLLTDQLVRETHSVSSGQTMSVSHSGLPKVLAQRKKLSTAMQNIFGVVRKFASSETARLGISAELTEQSCLMAFDLEGTGLSPKQVRRMMDYSSKASGSGVASASEKTNSLAFTRELVESMGGKLDLSSSTDPGTVLTLAIPV